jgi:hypothetical protein
MSGFQTGAVLFETNENPAISARYGFSSATISGLNHRKPGRCSAPDAKLDYRKTTRK